MKKIIIFLLAVVQSLISLAQPANDDPCGAISLTVQTGTICTPSNPFSWTGATATAGIPDPGCATYSTGDIWFSFVAPANGQANINTAAGSGGGAITDGGMAVYYNPGLCSVLTFALYACDDDSGPGNMPALNLTGLLPGITYYIRFWDYYDATSGNIGGICVTDPNPPLATTGAVGIGIQNPDNLLDVNGSLKIRGGNPGLNKVLTSDANGLASWVSPVVPVPFDPIPFKGTNSVNITIPNGILTSINFNVEEYDVGGNFSSGVFTAPATGIYHFDVNISWSLSSVVGSAQTTLYLKVSGSTVKEAFMLEPFSGLYSQTISAEMNLTASQTVQLSVQQFSGSSQIISCNTGSVKLSYFNGHRIN